MLDKPKKLIARIPEGYYAAGTEVELRNSPGVLAEFSGTPEGIVCPSFWRLSVGNQCRFGCSYCFLQGTMREMVPIPALFMEHQGMMRNVLQWLQRPGSLMLNIGELSDSLDFDDYTKASSWLVPMFGRQSRHRLLMLTKSDNVDRLLGLDHAGMTTVSWSVNAHLVAYRFEGIAPTVQRRLIAARRVQDAGYPVRLRIDPMVPIFSWKNCYLDLIQMAKLAGVKPEVITLGSLRFMPSVKPQAVRNGRNLDVFGFTAQQHDPDRRARIPEEDRIEMYRFMLGQLAEVFPGARLGLCKETIAVREAVGVLGADCNCTVLAKEAVAVG